MNKSRTRQSGLCPCCDRFIGPVRTCPYCDEDAAENRAVRALQWASVLLAVVGLVCLYFAAACKELPTVPIGEITPVMNFARIHLRGTVARPPYVALENGKVNYLSFQIDDASGRARVAARDNVAQALVDRGLVPQSGAAIDVTGSLRISYRAPPKLYLQSADHLVVRAPGK
ncbi:hypothetical protein ACFLQU_01025 [Verrucomicrobiota bacterium]